MSRASVAAVIATLTTLGVLAPTGAASAASCIAAPKPPAPQGQHWYYRTDRSLGRKCWYLAEVGRKGKAVAAQPAADDDDTDTEADAKPAAAMAEAAARLTEPLRSPPPPAAVRPAIETATVAQADPNAPIRVPTETIRRSDEPAAAAIAQEPAPSIVPEPAVVEPPPALAPVPAVPAAAASARTNLMQFVFVAFVGLCLMAGLFIYLAAMRSRREIRIVDLNTPAPLRRPDIAAMSDSPSVAPDEGAHRDEGALEDERLRRFARTWKERAA